MAKPTKIWVSALIPAQGADIYDGIRVQASLSRKDCYQDLSEWLGCITYRGPKATEAALERATYVEDILRLWKVEEQEVYL